MPKPRRIPASSKAITIHKLAIEYLVGLDHHHFLSVTDDPGYMARQFVFDNFNNNYGSYCLVFHALVVGEEYYKTLDPEDDAWGLVKQTHKDCGLPPCTSYFRVLQSTLTQKATDKLNKDCLGLWCWIPDKVCFSHEADAVLHAAAR